MNITGDKNEYHQGAGNTTGGCNSENEVGDNKNPSVGSNETTVVGLKEDE